MSDSSTPGWLKGLIIVFAVTSAATFGLFLYRHGEDASLRERYRGLLLERDALRVYVPKLAAQVTGTPAPLDAQILARRQKLKEITEAEQQTMGDVSRIVGETTVHQSEAAKLMQAEAKKYVELLADAKTRRTELQAEEERAMGVERDLDDRRVKLREQLQIASRELEVLKRDARNSNTGQDSRISELDARILELTQQRELNNRELRADGRILASRATDGFVVIDRGQDDNLRKGMRFTVFNRRGGKPVVKGIVEVVEIEARMAVCRVLSEQNASDPLIPGDMVHNPVYNPGDVKIFVIKGDFTQYSIDELSRFITEAGGKVAKDLTTASDYLVAGDRADAALEQASKLGISILSEDQLIELVRPVGGVAIGKGMVVVLKGRFTKVSAGSVSKLIEQSGGSVQGSIESGVDLLIIGEDAGEDAARARALGIKVIDHASFTYLNEKN